MKQWWNWVFAIGLGFFFFIVVPLWVTRKPSQEDIKAMFDDYLKQFNKTYTSPEEYLTRLQHFVNHVGLSHNEQDMGSPFYLTCPKMNLEKSISRTRGNKRHLICSERAGLNTKIER
ncbi:putative Cathepsin O [Operophtera brumata]|uniref:Putative Cathepsin O n=1 Tax=Operophtera brumata TaxID=104452 RepID=A0A0L7KS57_OPEBR|nr:putative Cathepsin O [Operophtera brumata]